MSKWKRSLLILVTLMAVVLAGCGSSEVVLKEFTSADGAVSISMNEKWAVEDMGVDNWLAAFTSDGSEGIIVMQLDKRTYGTSVADVDGVKTIVEASFTTSDMADAQAPAIPELSNVSAYTCKVEADGVKGDGMVVYGETDYAYYSILFAAPRINAKRAEYFNNVCATLKETAPEVEAASDTVLWFNGTCAVLTKVNGWDYTIFGGMPADEYAQGIAASLLSEWWEVTDRDSADETMDWLISEGHRTSFVEEMEILEEAGLGEIAEEERADALLENFELEEEDAQDYADWYGAYEQYGDDVIAGWDYSRAMSLLGNYYLAGYYTEEEALDLSLTLAGIIQDTFDSWDSFLDSYFIGYEYWAGESSQERRGIYEDIKAASDSPYSLDWNMSLEKTW